MMGPYNVLQAAFVSLLSILLIRSGGQDSAAHHPHAQVQFSPTSQPLQNEPRHEWAACSPTTWSSTYADMK